MKKLLVILLIIILIVGCSRPLETKEMIEPTTPEVVEVPDKQEDIAVVENHNVNSKTQIIEITNSGFNPRLLRVKSGDKVIWRNLRTGYNDQVILRGTRQCVDIRSPTLRSGEEFSWTFNRLRNCIIVDAVRHRQTSEVIVQ